MQLLLPWPPKLLPLASVHLVVFARHQRLPFPALGALSPEPVCLLCAYDGATSCTCSHVGHFHIHPLLPPPPPAQTSILNPKPVALTSWTSPLGRFQGHLRGTMSQAEVTIAPQTLLPLQLLCLLWGKSGTFTRDDAWIPSPPPSKLIFNSVDLAALCFPPAQSQSARFPTTRVLSPAQITPVDSCMASETPFHPFLDSASFLLHAGREGSS